MLGCNLFNKSAVAFLKILVEFMTIHFADVLILDQQMNNNVEQRTTKLLVLVLLEQLQLLLGFAIVVELRLILVGRQEGLQG
jgi:hypothetical protein